MELDFKAPVLEWTPSKLLPHIYFIYMTIIY
jgi:hypothetical protein